MIGSVPILLLDDRFFGGVLERRISSTIRIGERAHLSEGDRIMLVSARGGFLPVMVSITGIRHLDYEDLSRYDTTPAGFASVEEAKAALVGFYPNIVGTTPVTVIEFEKL